MPYAGAEIEEKLLTLATGETARKSLEEWADRCIRAHDYELQVDGVCSSQALQAHGDEIDPLTEKAVASDVATLSVDEISRTLGETSRSAAGLSSLVRLMTELLQAAGRDPGAAPDVKSEAMAAGYLHVVPKIRQESLRYRSQALMADTIGEELRAAQTLAEEAKSAAAEARFSEQAVSSLAESLPSVVELRRAAGTLRSTGFFGKLFGGEWRAARAVCRQTFPDEPKLPPIEAAKRLLAAALWKDRVQRLGDHAEAKEAAGRYWKGTETPFDRLAEVAEWMRSVQKVTPPVEPGARELRRLAFESGPDEFAMLVRFAFQKAYASRSTIHEEAARQQQRVSALGWILRTAQKFAMQPKQSVSTLQKARQMSLEAKALRQQMAADVMATNACSALSAGSELERAKSVRATSRFVEKLQSSKIPQSVARHLLQEGYERRLFALRQLAESLKLAGAEVDRAARDANELLTLRPEEWCGGPLNAVPIREQMQKCERAAQASDALEKQIALLSTEFEAANHGLGG